MKFITHSGKETQKIAEKIAADILKKKSSKAEILCLSGNLGAGKTTFTQGFARALGIKERVLSPTFVLMKFYKLSRKIKSKKYFVHIDCYRLDSPKDLLHLGFNELLKDKDALILIEWADKVKKIIPKKNTLWLKFRHGRNQAERVITVQK